MSKNGGFVWVNEEQMKKWGKADRPEGNRWDGTVHRADCSTLGLRGGKEVRLGSNVLRPDPPGRPPQTCLKCGGTGKPWEVQVAVRSEVGCPEWERENDHAPHAWRDSIDQRTRRCPGWSVS